MSSGQPPYEVVVEGDHLPRRSLQGIIVVTVLVVVACIVIVKLWLPPNRPITAGGLTGAAPREIGGVEQTLIAADKFAHRLQKQEEERLGTYGWVDRDKGLVRIPIERAMQLSVERAK